MILRAIFWIAVVSVLMPHEPDLGFGRPHLGVSLPAGLGALANEAGATTGRSCEGRQAACAAGLAALDQFQSIAVRSLSEVKADIEQSRREEFIRHHSS